MFVVMFTNFDDKSNNFQYHLKFENVEACYKKYTKYISALNCKCIF